MLDKWLGGVVVNSLATPEPAIYRLLGLQPPGRGGGVGRRHGVINTSRLSGTCAINVFSGDRLFLSRYFYTCLLHPPQNSCGSLVASCINEEDFESGDGKSCCKLFSGFLRPPTCEGVSFPLVFLLPELGYRGEVPKEF